MVVEYPGAGKGIKHKSPDGNRAVSIKADDKFPDRGIQGQIFGQHILFLSWTPDLAACSFVLQHVAPMSYGALGLFSQSSSPRPTFGYQQGLFIVC